MSFRIKFAAAALMLALPMLCLAQFDSATVLGTIRDQSGAVVASAKVTLTNVKTGIVVTAQSDSAGIYQFLNIPNGAYTTKAEAPGFKTAVAEQFVVTVGARQRVDLTLQVGEATQTVEVTGAAAALETDSSDRGQVMGGNTIVNLPLNGRNYADRAVDAGRAQVLHSGPRIVLQRERSAQRAEQLHGGRRG